MKQAEVGYGIFYTDKGSIEFIDFGRAFSFSHENGISGLIRRLGADEGDGEYFKINAVDSVFYAEEEDLYCVLFCGLPKTDKAYPYNVLDKVEEIKKEVVASLSTDLFYLAWDSYSFLIVLPYVRREALVCLREKMKLGYVGIYYDIDNGLSLKVNEPAEEQQEYQVTVTGVWKTYIAADSAEEAEEKAFALFDPAYLKDNIQVHVI